MSWELDHVFFATAEREMVEGRLAAFGFVLSAGRIHRGQGTANTYVTFENAFFEASKFCSRTIKKNFARTLSSRLG